MIRSFERSLIVLSVLISTFFGVTGGAAVDASADSATQDLAATIRETKEVINEAESERRRILGSLYAINLRMKKISKDKSELTDDLIQSQDAVERVVIAIQTLEAQISKQRISLKSRLRALYKISGESFIGAIFSSQNAYEFDSTLRNLKIISDNDFQMIRSYRENLRTLAKQRLRLKSQVEKLLLVEKRIQRQEKLLSQEHLAKSNLAASIEKSTRQRISEIHRLRKNHSAADAEIAHLLKPSMYEKKGSLAAPVGSGVISKDFGLHVDPVFKFRMSHKGWQIKVPSRTAVVSTDEGRVVFVDHLEDHGRTLIVDHGDHYYSVYIGLSSARVVVGDTVSRNHILGQVDGELYFEIRHFSEPENPASWISAKSSLLAQKGRNLSMPVSERHARANIQ